MRWQGFASFQSTGGFVQILLLGAAGGGGGGGPRGRVSAVPADNCEPRGLGGPAHPVENSAPQSAVVTGQLFPSTQFISTANIKTRIF